MAKVHIGTSGFNYSHWKDGVFYPKDLVQAKWLSFYASKFNSVELNVTFYRLPKRSVFGKWQSQTSRDFTFAVKGSRFITHVKKLKNVKDPVKIFFSEAQGLGQKLSVVLWQLPGNLRVNVEKLEDLAKILSRDKVAAGVRQAFEFRHESWFCGDIYKVLKKYNFALCIAHSNAWPSVEVVTADYVYLRFHGGRILFTSNYSKKELGVWAKKINKWISEGKDVYAYFNNDAMGYAIDNARTLGRLVG